MVAIRLRYRMLGRPGFEVGVRLPVSDESDLEIGSVGICSHDSGFSSCSSRARAFM